MKTYLKTQWFLAGLLLTLVFSSPVWAYTYTESGGVEGGWNITKIYGGADTSFIYITGDVNGRCPSQGMYLGDPDTALTSAQSARLLALAMQAYSQNKQVLLNYKYTTETGDTYACYAFGIQIQD